MLQCAWSQQHNPAYGSSC